MTQVIINGISRGQLNADLVWQYVQTLKRKRGVNIVTWSDTALVVETIN